MAIIDYKEKYEQALEVAQRFYNNSVAITKKGLEDIFPELAGSEDERIRKALLNEFIHLQSKDYKFAGLEGEDIISWLEKQGEKAKYHDICDKCVRQPTCQSDCFLQQDEQKKEWSKKDEYYRNIILYILNNECVGKTDKENVINWLKSLKDRVQPQPKQEWSYEDERLFQIVIDILYRQNHFGNISRTDLIACVRKLKSLRHQSQWKPSDEQMKMVDEIINVLSQMQLFGGRNALIDLKHDLEKLREE